MGAAVGLVVVLGIAVGVVLTLRHSPSKSSNALPLASTRSVQPRDTTSDNLLSTPITSTEPSTTAPPIYQGNAIVSVAPAAGYEPTAPAVVDLLSRYFTDINTGDFADYRSLFTPAISENLSTAQLEQGYRSTIDSHARLTDLTTAADGRPAAIVTFTSHQDSVDGPDGETCTQWQVAFFLETTDNGYLFGKPPTDYHAQHQAC